MSVAGIVQFEKNLRSMMDSEAFNSADDAQKLNLGYRLLKSEYGLGKLGKVSELPVADKMRKK